MRSRTSFSVLVLLALGSTYSHQLDNNRVRSARFHYGGWKPVRGKSFYTRNTSDLQPDPSQQNLYVVVPTILVNTARPPLLHNDINKHEDYHVEESRIQEQRAAPDPYPISEPSPDLTLLAPKFKHEDQIVQESQQSFHRAVYPPDQFMDSKLNEGARPQGAAKHGDNQRPTYEISHQGLLHLKPIKIMPHFGHPVGNGNQQPNGNIRFRPEEQNQNVANEGRDNLHPEENRQEFTEQQQHPPHPDFQQKGRQFGLRIRYQNQLIENLNDQKNTEHQDIRDERGQVTKTEELVQNKAFKIHVLNHPPDQNLPPPVRPIHPPIVSNQPPQSSPSVFQRTVNSQLHFKETEKDPHSSEDEKKYFVESLSHPVPPIVPQPDAGSDTNSENYAAPPDTYFPPLVPQPGVRTEIQNTNIAYQAPVRNSVPPVIPSTPYLPETGKIQLLHSNQPPSFSCDVSCRPRISFRQQEEELASIANRYEADALFHLVSLPQDGIVRLVAAGGLYTLFIPSNEAVARLPQQLIQRWQQNPQSLMFSFLNHAISNRETLESLRQKRAVESRSNGATLFINDYRNDTVTVNGRRLVHANIPAPHGGIVHIVDGMLFPAADKDIFDMITSCDRFDGFLTLAEVADILGILRGRGPFTLFLPSNEALAKIEMEDKDLLRSNITTLKEFLLYHIVEGVYYSNDLLDGQYLPTLEKDQSVKAGVRVDGCHRRLVEVNNSPVFRSDIPATNGVIHVVDWVLRPTDLDWCEGVILP